MPSTITLGSDALRASWEDRDEGREERDEDCCWSSDGVLASLQQPMGIPAPTGIVARRWPHGAGGVIMRRRASASPLLDLRADVAGTAVDALVAQACRCC